MNAYDILKERGFIKDATDEKSIRALLDKQKISFYVGFDPTAPSLHIGNLEQLMAMMHLARGGHKAIALIGGGTGLIGDPSDKDRTRPLSSINKINENSASLKNQIGKILVSPKCVLLNNSYWISRLNYLEFLRDAGRHFSVNRLLAVDWIKKRLKTGLTFLEFNYQLLQAYDFWYLFKNYGCVLQLGGSDQWGNIVAGIELIRKIESKEAFGITLPLLTTAGGKKMGKSEKGAVWLDPRLTSPYDYYQFWMNVDDKDVKKFLLLFTFLPVKEVKKYAKLKGESIRGAKEVLAYETAKIIHGEKEAEAARDASQALWRRIGVKNAAVPTTLIKRDDLKNGIPAFKLFTIAGLSKSASEAQRLVAQGGAYINNERINNFALEIKESDFKKGELILRAGKKKHHRLVVRD